MMDSLDETADLHEEALKKSEEKYRQLVENANEYIVVLQDGLVRFMNTRAREETGLVADAPCRTFFAEFIHPDDRDMVLECCQRRVHGEQSPSTCSFRFMCRNGEVKWLEVNAVNVEWEGTPATMNFLTDVTRRKRFEEELKQSEARNRLYFENANDIIIVVDSDLKVRSISPRIRHMLGYEPEELIGKTIGEITIIKPDYREKMLLEINRMLSGERISSSVYEAMTKDGRYLFFEISGAPLVNDGKVSGIICIARNIEERKKIEDALRESEKRYREILEQIDDGYFEVDLKGSFTFFNKAMHTMLRYDPGELLGMNNRRYMNKENAFKVYSTFNSIYMTGNPGRAFDLELIRKDGSQCFVETSVSLMRDARGNPTGFRGVARDVTEQKLLEYQLYQRQKMEAIGTLAGGIAHDFNNILSGIIGYTELALMEIRADNPVARNLEQVLRAGNRAKELVKQILTFSRQSEQEKKPINIGNVVEEALRMIRASLPSTIEIRRELEVKDCVIQADPTQVHQIVVNLCTNAYHAVKENNGSITVGLKDTDLETHALNRISELKPGLYVDLSVVDTGCGMPVSVMERIFNPYFTTKAMGEGTGLGLAIVHGIVKSLGGAITVDSTPGKGSSFHVYLPRKKNTLRQELSRTEAIPAGHEHILVVDDEITIVEMIGEMLRKLGYTVTAKSSSLEALEVFRERCGEIDLIMSDLTMPRMNGDHLAKKVHEIRPDIPVVLCTGFSEGISEEVSYTSGIKDVMLKPIILKDLAKTIRGILDEKK